MNVDGWTGTYGGGAVKYIHPLPLSGFISKKNPTLCCSCALIPDSVRPRASRENVEKLSHCDSVTKSLVKTP